MPETKAPPPQHPKSPAPIPRSDRPAPEPAHTAPRHDVAAPLPQRLTVRIAGRIVGALIVVGAIVLGTYVTHLYYVYPRTDDAYVRANIVGIAPHVSGPITELPVASGLNHTLPSRVAAVASASTLRPRRLCD